MNADIKMGFGIPMLGPEVRIVGLKLEGRISISRTVGGCGVRFVRREV